MPQSSHYFGGGSARELETNISIYFVEREIFYDLVKYKKTVATAILYYSSDDTRLQKFMDL